MSEENNLVYCSQCGSGNPSTFKFCSSCGAKLEQPKGLDTSFTNSRQEEAAQPAYEKVDAEIVSEGRVNQTEDEIHINYGPAEEGTYTSGYYSTSNSDFTASDNSSMKEQSNGNIGLSIASMVCGILSMICCCLSCFSLVLGIAAIVLGIISLCGRYDGKGMAIAGIVTGGVGLFVWLVFLLIGGSDMFVDILDELY